MERSNPSMHFSEHEHEETVDLVQLLMGVIERWKMISLVVFIAALLSVIYALSQPNIYKSTVELSKPTESSLATLNNGAISKYTVEGLFKRFYDKARSIESFKSYVIESGALSQLFPDVDDPTEIERQALFKVLDGFEPSVIAIDEKDSFLAQIDGITFSYTGLNEQVTADLVNQYIPYVGNLVVGELTEIERKLIETNKQKILLDIKVLRNKAKQDREYEITRRKEANQLKLVELNQTKQLLIEKTTADRLTKIKTLQEENRLKLARLEQKKALLVEKARQDRLTLIATKIESNNTKIKALKQKKSLLIAKAKQDKLGLLAEAREALRIASTLNIADPTELDELRKSKSNVTTEINMNGKQQLPLYLMGTRYLNILIKTLEDRDDDATLLLVLNELSMEIETLEKDVELATLKQRESDAKYLAELNQINMQIAEVENDAELKQLQNRKFDENFIAELNVIDQQIAAIKDDKSLANLEQRQSDDPYIPQIAALLGELSRLEALNVDFSDVKAYTVNSSALVLGRKEGPKRALFVIGSVLVSSFLVVIWVLVSAAFARRRQYAEKQTAYP